MAEPPELWSFLVANLLVFVFGTTLATLSYATYRRRACHPVFRDATLGFSLVTIGGLVEPVYQLAIKQGYQLAGRELLALQTLEGGLVALGLGFLFYSIYRHDRSTSARSSSVRD